MNLISSVLLFLLLGLTIHYNLLLLAMTIANITCAKDVHQHQQQQQKEQQQLRLIARMKPTHLIRKRRYVAFPEGSSFSTAVCSTIGLIGNPNFNIFSYGLNWGVGYDLPNQTWVLNHLNGFANTKMETKDTIKRRHRRELYKNIENIFNNVGYNGRHCVLRTLCESSKIFLKKENNMILEILRTIFTFPISKALHSEHPDVDLYIRAFMRGLDILHCASLYEECDFSLINLILGRFSKY